jgi:hypothetical protein
MNTKNKKIYSLISFISAIMLLFLFFLFSPFVRNADAQDFFMDESINAYTITRFESGFTEYEVRISWLAFGVAEEYKIFKSVNQGEFEEIRNIDYEDEGFQLWWIDEDIMEGNNYSYYIEGYFQQESVGTTDTVNVDFWLPSCQAEYPVNNEIVVENNPEFKWKSISVNTFPFKNSIFSAEGEFILFDLTTEEEIKRVEIEDFNISSLKLFSEEETSEVINENNLDSEIDITTENETEITEKNEDDTDANISKDENNENTENDESSPKLIIKHKYQWQFKVIGYDDGNQAIAESITGGFFSFQEKSAEDEAVEDEEEPVEGGLNIDAGFISYQIIDGKDVIVAREGVALSYQDINLKANYIEIKIEDNELVAKENVDFNKGEESYTCSALNYNWETEKIIMDDMSGEATGDKIKGKVYYQGGKLENFPETVEIDSGVFTTCDLEEPHWHIEAEKITIYIDDKIIAKKVSWYEGKRKLFTLPSFMIFLRGKNQFPYWPNIGQSSSEGWFLKNQFNYVRDAESYGSYYLDWMQKKGFAAGIEHTFELGEEKVDDGELVLYFYGLKRKNASIFDLDAKIDYWQNFENSLKLRANVTYDGTINYGAGNSSHSIKPDFYFYKKWDDSLLTITSKYNFNKTTSTSSSGNIKLSYDNKITDRLDSSLDILYTSDSPASGETGHELRPEWLLKYSGNGYTLNLVTEKQIDLNEGLFSGGNSPNTLDKLPELTFKKPSTKIKDTDINYSIDASIGRYYEGATDQDNIRGEYIINVNRPFKINDNISLNASGLYRQDVYLSGEARYQLGGKLDLKVGYRPEFYGNLSYSYYMSEGPTPFNFDTLSPLTESAKASIVLNPTDTLQVNLSTNYNFVNESFGNLGIKAQWKPKDDYDIYVSTYYDLNNMQWNKKVDTKMALKLSDEWKMTYSGSVYFDDFDIRNSVISVVKDLHCREISINYRQSTQSIWLDFKINAFPTESITIGG